MLQGLEAEDWPCIRQIVAEVHSRELLEAVTAMLEQHYTRVTIEQDRKLANSHLFLVYATHPRGRAGTDREA